MTDWPQIIDDIHEAIKSASIVKERNDQSSDEAEEINIEENFDLQKILDLNQVSVKQAEDIENFHLA